MVLVHSMQKSQLTKLCASNVVDVSVMTLRVCSTYIEHECKVISGSILSSHNNHVASRKLTWLFTFPNGCLPSLKMPKIIFYRPASVTKKTRTPIIFQSLAKALKELNLPVWLICVQWLIMTLCNEFSY